MKTVNARLSITAVPTSAPLRLSSPAGVVAGKNVSFAALDLVARVDSSQRMGKAKELLAMGASLRAVGGARDQRSTKWRMLGRKR
jgi:hypothetical protein